MLNILYDMQTYTTLLISKGVKVCKSNTLAQHHTCLQVVQGHTTSYIINSDETLIQCPHSVSKCLKYSQFD